MIGIINYGMGNLASVKHAFDYLHIESKIISDSKELNRVDKIVLPGVGAFGMAMENLNKSGFDNAIKECVLVKKKPILGICLGMQLLLDSSIEHGYHKGLEIMKGQILFFGDSIKNLPIPHMGWNDLEFNPNAFLFKNIEPLPSFYFVHSYYCELSNLELVTGTTNYGISFHSSFENEYIFGCQFHPEKSQKNGLSVLKKYNAL